MQKTDDAAPATRGDLESLWIRIDKRFEEMDQRFTKKFSLADKRFDDIDLRFKDIDLRFKDIDLRFNDIDNRFDDMKLHFGIVAEAMLQDFTGAFGDRLSQNSDEIKGVKARVSAVERRLRFSRK